MPFKHTEIPFIDLSVKGIFLFAAIFFFNASVFLPVLFYYSLVLLYLCGIMYYTNS